MRKTLCLTAAIICAVLVCTAQAQTKDRGTGFDLRNSASGRDKVDHDAIRQRSLRVLEAQFGAWRTASARLHEASQNYCEGPDPDRAALDHALQKAWTAWAPLDSYQFGPIEQSSAVLHVNFWPDKKNFVGKALQQLLSKPSRHQRNPDHVANLSAAAQGYPAIEMLLYSEMPECPAIIGISARLYGMSGTLYDLWFAAGGWAELARTAGPKNPVYQSAEEFTKTLYTAVDFGLARIADTRLGRPLGTPTQPFPKRAEAWRSGLTNDLIAAQLDGAAALIQLGFADDLRDPIRASILHEIGRVQIRLRDIAMPISRAVNDPASRFRVEALQTQVHHLQSQIGQGLGPSLGVNTGFSAADGD